MRNQKAKRSRLSRKTKIVLYLAGTALILLLAYAVYEVLHIPVIGPESAFRRAEKANLLGPSSILGIETDPLRPDRQLIFAETGQGYLIYPYVDGASNTGTEIQYFEKADDSVILTSVGSNRALLRGVSALPIIVFDNLPGARSARLDIDYRGSYNAGRYDNERSFSCTVQRKNSGYFLFSLPYELTGSTAGMQRDNALFEISRCLNNGEKENNTVISITVSYYRKDGTLIAERSIEY